MRPEIISRIISHSLSLSLFKKASEIFLHSSQLRIASCCSSLFSFNFIERINEKGICVYKLRRSFKINYERRGGEGEGVRKRKKAEASE